MTGTAVRARGLSWEVLQVQPAGTQVRYRLRCTEPSIEGRELELLSPFETVQSLVPSLDPRRAGSLRDWVLYHEAHLLEQLPGNAALVAVPAGRLTMAPYQLVPVLRALGSTRPRLLLADGVGLGKTVEAGLIMAELVARRRAERILIVATSAPLLQQWREELSSRFGLAFEPLADWPTLQTKRARLALGANPFDQAPLALTTLDFAKQDKILDELERCTWDLVVIDEAHHVMRHGAVGDAEDSRRRRLAELLARQSDGLLLLTATPFDGSDEHFASLIELLDPSLIDSEGVPRRQAYQRHIVRRLKHQLSLPGSNEPLFRTRVVRSQTVAIDPEIHAHYAALQQAVQTLTAPRLRAASWRRRDAEVLSFVGLLKRLQSTARAAGFALGAVARHVADADEPAVAAEDTRRQRQKTLGEYRRRLERYGTLSAEEALDQAELEAEDIAASLIAEDSSETMRQRLRDLCTLAELAEAQDPKLAALVDVIEAIRSQEPTTNVLVYTEYVESQRAVLHALGKARQARRIDGEILSLNSSDPDAARAASVARFGGEDRLILVSTDATAEGLNLHRRCHHLVHLELPLNPNRLEQRNGRIDRFGQVSDPVVWYLSLKGTFEERLLLELTQRYEQQRALGAQIPQPLRLVQGDRTWVTEALLSGLVEDASIGSNNGGNAGNAGPPADVDHDAPNQAASHSYQAILDDVDRALGTLTLAMRRHAWLFGEGVGTEPGRLSEVMDVQRLAAASHNANLLQFVQAVLVSETQSTAVVSHPATAISELSLPSTWAHDPSDLVGFDASSGRWRLTSDPEVERTPLGQDVAFLGRAHPIVRRALDRMRCTVIDSAPGSARPHQAEPRDRRISAARGPELALVLTYQGALRSATGREFEQIVAVRVSPHQAPSALLEPQFWLRDLREPKPCEALWERHFAAWAGDLEPTCRAVAQAAFDQLAAPFLRAHRSEQALALRQLEQWLLERTQALCGARQAQLSLMTPTDSLPTWRTASRSLERLAALKADMTVSHSRRQQASDVLSIHREHCQHLNRRQCREPMLVNLVGILLLVPEVDE